jgi:hypothetical protein
LASGDDYDFSIAAVQGGEGGALGYTFMAMDFVSTNGDVIFSCTNYALTSFNTSVTNYFGLAGSLVTGQTTAHFTGLLDREDVPEEDKKKIRELLKKRWNPYVHRHSAITEKSGIISSDQKLRQFAGWTPRSNMHYKYVHFSGGESMKDLLRAKGILKDDKHSVNVLAPKTCPNCREPNRPDAQFCFKCNFVMSFEVYQKGMEERQTKDLELQELKEQTSKMQQDFKSYDESVKEVIEKVSLL